MIARQELEAFIWEVFNYYNGKINPINKAVLNINWAGLYESGVTGRSHVPNIVMINAESIFIFFDDNIECTKFVIIETIIHELYHTDQLIDYNLLNADTNYRQCLEAACEVQTAMYMLNHINEIEKLLESDISRPALNYFKDSIIKFEAYKYTYIRRTPLEHVVLTLNAIVPLGYEYGIKFMEDVSVFCNINKDISLTVNGLPKLYICDAGRIIDIGIFNHYIGSIYYNYAANSEIEYYYDEDELVIKLNYIPQNVMCDIIE